MVSYPAGTGTLDDVFAALADPTRRAIVSRLAEGDATVSELARPFPMSLPAVSKHLRMLERAGLLEHRKHGRSRICRLSARRMRAADDWLSHYRRFWDARLESLDRFLREEDR
jgi:DNA-binding transcriptional ArsR family regulator